MRLHSTIDVIEALGGTSAVAEMTGRTYNAAHNWRTFGKFPANTYLTFQQALEAKGQSAPSSLWGMTDHSSDQDSAS